MKKMVPPAGIEPALPKERDFESRASTSSARGATGTGERAYHGVLSDASASARCLQLVNSAMRIRTRAALFPDDP